VQNVAGAFANRVILVTFAKVLHGVLHLLGVEGAWSCTCMHVSVATNPQNRGQAAAVGVAITPQEQRKAAALKVHIQ
jgi:hypothetical protein